MPTLADYSVKFGRDPVGGLEGKNAFPFFYSLVNHNDVDWVPGLTPPDISTYAIPCRANGVTPHYVRLDADYNYKLIAIKYLTLGYDAPNEQPNNWNPLEKMNPASLYISEIPGGTYYNGYIKVSLMAQGSGSQTLFGGQNVQSINNLEAKIPLAVSCQQGWDYGFQAMRCEYLWPLQGVMSFEFTNTHPYMDLYVAAMIYGLKIRL